MTVNPTGNRFCGSCGAALGSQPRVSQEPDWATTSGWGELKQVTALFADIVSSTEQIAALDPEQAMQRLQPVVALMCDAVERFGGTVVRTLGDGVMALFGVPLALEGHARLACEAAMAMQQAIALTPMAPRIRIGLHSGVVASDPGTDGARGKGAHGLTIHLASRIMDQAEPDQICLSGECEMQVRSSCETQPLGSRMLKGIATPMPLFALLGRLPDSTNPQFHEASLTPFYGREAEMRLLQTALTERAEGAPRVIGLAGAPGTGKSRLCHEFAQWCQRQNVPVYQVRTQLYGHARPLQSVLELLRGYFFRILPEDDGIVARSRVAQRMSETGAFSDADLALMFDFLGLSNPEATSGAFNPRLRHARLMHILRALFAHVATTPSVLIIEDLHWLDDASEEFIDALVHAAAGTQAMVLLNFRPSYLSPWVELRHYRQLDLQELDEASTRRLVQSLMGDQPKAQELAWLVASRSGGNPFFAEELTRTLRTSAATLPHPDPHAALELALPSSVQAVIGARIDRLEESQKHLLQVCATVGKEIALDVLYRVTGAPAAEVDRILDALCRSAMMQPLVGTAGRSFVFRHPLIQEVAYGMQLKTRRAALHARLAAGMESHYHDRLDEFAGLIGHHYEVAGMPVEAAHHLARAAQWVGSTDSAQAIVRWRKVRELLLDQPGAADAARLRALACSKIAWLSWREGLPMEDLLPYIEEAKAAAAGIDERLVRLQLFLEGRVLQANGGPVDRYVALVQQALSQVPGDSARGTRVVLHAALCQAHGWSGQLHQALAAADAALREMDAVDTFEQDFIGYSIEQWVSLLRGRLLARLGRAEEARQGLLRIIGFELVDPVLIQIAHYGLAEVACHSEQLALARQHADHVTQIADKHENAYLKVFSLACQALVDRAEGRLANAAKRTEQALATVRDGNVAREFETELLVNLAECHHGLDQPPRAVHYAEQAIELSHARNNRIQHIRALTVAAALRMDRGAQGDLEQAGEWLRQALDLQAHIGHAVHLPELARQQSRWVAQTAAQVSGER